MVEPNLAVTCTQCQKIVTACEKGSFLQPEDADGVAFARYALAQCPSCSTPLLLKHAGEDRGYEGEWGPPAVLYPSTAGSFEPFAPPLIVKSYKEAVRTFEQARAYTATAIMCRRTVEGICDHFRAKGKNLSEKLEELRKAGTIDEKTFQWANDLLRALGNDAAHDVSQVIEREEAKEALEFTRAIIEYIFVFHVAFEKFMMKRKRKALKGGTT